MIVNNQNLQTLFIAFKAAFRQGFDGAATQYEKIATVITGNAITFEYGFLGQFPQLREWIGDRHIKSMEQFAYKVTNVPYEATVAVSKRLIEADQHGLYTPIFASAGEAARQHPDNLIMPALLAGTSSLCYDGQYFFDTDHPENGASVSNEGGGAGADWFLLCTNRVLKPLIFQKRKDYDIVALTDPNDENVFMRNEFLFGVDGDGAPAYGMWQQAYHSRQTLDATNYGAARAAIMSRKTDKGRPLNLMPNLLVVGPSLEKAARELVAPTTTSGGYNAWANSAEVMVTPYLT